MLLSELPVVSSKIVSDDLGEPVLTEILNITKEKDKFKIN